MNKFNLIGSVSGVAIFGFAVYWFCQKDTKNGKVKSILSPLPTHLKRKLNQFKNELENNNLEKCKAILDQLSDKNWEAVLPFIVCKSSKGDTYFSLVIKDLESKFEQFKEGDAARFDILNYELLQPILRIFKNSGLYFGNEEDLKQKASIFRKLLTQCDADGESILDMLLKSRSSILNYQLIRLWNCVLFKPTEMFDSSNDEKNYRLTSDEALKSIPLQLFLRKQVSFLHTENEKEKRMKKAENEIEKRRLAKGFGLFREFTKIQKVKILIREEKEKKTIPNCKTKKLKRKEKKAPRPLPEKKPTRQESSLPIKSKVEETSVKLVFEADTALPHHRLEPKSRREEDAQFHWALRDSMKEQTKRQTQKLMEQTMYEYQALKKKCEKVCGQQDLELPSASTQSKLSKKTYQKNKFDLGQDVMDEIIEKMKQKIQIYKDILKKQSLVSKKQSAALNPMLNTQYFQQHVTQLSEDHRLLLLECQQLRYMVNNLCAAATPQMYLECNQLFCEWNQFNPHSPPLPLMSFSDDQLLRRTMENAYILYC